MILPYRSKNPPESLPIATISLIVINTIIYFGTSENGLMIKEGVISKFGLTYNNISPLTILSSMFLHADPLHLIGNMLFLYLFGFAVEGRLKSVKFIGLYLLAGVAGDLCHTLAVGAAHPDLPSLGASGAIMGVLGAAMWMFPFAPICYWYLGYYWWIPDADGFTGTVDFPLWSVGCYYLAFDILGALMTRVGGGGGVANLAHLGGAAAGFFICMALRPKRDDKHTSEAKAWVDETKDYTMSSRRDLAKMYEANPKDDFVLMHWMVRCQRDGVGDPECERAFLARARAMLSTQDAATMGQCLLQLAQQQPGKVSPRLLVEAGGPCERANANDLAKRIYEFAYAMPGIDIDDRCACLYRVALLCESVWQNYDRAKVLYGELVKISPMSPLADSARVRLKVLEPRASV